MSSQILVDESREKREWKITRDPSGDFILNGLFGLRDISATAYFHFWAPGTRWENVRSGKVITYEQGKICQS